MGLGMCGHSVKLRHLAGVCNMCLRATGNEHTGSRLFRGDGVCVGGMGNEKHLYRQSQYSLPVCASGERERKRWWLVNRWWASLAATGMVDGARWPQESVAEGLEAAVYQRGEGVVVGIVTKQ